MPIRAFLEHDHSFAPEDIEQILLAALPPFAWPHRESPAPSVRAKENHGLRVEGILKIQFARKSPSKGQNPANSITSAHPISQPAQGIQNSSRTTD
jgi:hypothetical protein